MSRKMYCQYCGCKTTNLSGMCTPCMKKLELIRQIRTIVFAIKREAEREREMRLRQEEKEKRAENERVKENEQAGNHKDVQTVQRLAS